MSDAGLSVPPRPPRSNEIDAARRWIASGASLDQLRDIFRQGIHGKRALGEQAPSSLAWFDKRVEAAVKTEADTTDQWRRRVELFKQHGVEGWPQSWGRPPTDPLCEAPAEIVRAVLGA